MAGTIDGDPIVEVLVLADCDPDLSLLAPADQERYRRFIDTDAADAYLRRQSELRRRLGALLGIDPKDVALSTIGNDKPILAGQDQPFHFNMSSSGPLMALAINHRGPIGVDIECHEIHHGLLASSLAPALHESELRLLAAGNLDDILQCWVLKEAWIKWTAEGMRADLKNLHLWRPGLQERFTVGVADVTVQKIGPGTGRGPDRHQAWLGVVRAAADAVERGS